MASGVGRAAPCASATGVVPRPEVAARLLPAATPVAVGDGDGGRPRGAGVGSFALAVRILAEGVAGAAQGTALGGRAGV